MKFPCQECDQQFQNKRSIQDHIKTVHLKEKNFKCELCPKKFSRSFNLKVHVKTVHIKSKEKFKLKKTLNSKFPLKSVSQFPCHLCDSKFKVSANLNRHIKTVHLKEKKFKCELCDKWFGHKCDLQSNLTSKEFIRRFRISLVTSARKSSAIAKV